MKNIWIYNSLDGPICFSTPKKAYNYASLSGEISYAVYLKYLRDHNRYTFKRKEDLSIEKLNVH